MSLRRQNMTVTQNCPVPEYYRAPCLQLAARARKLWGLLTEASDSKTRIGETLSALRRLERKALEKFAKVNPSSNVAVAYLNAARDARKKLNGSCKRLD